MKKILNILSFFIVVAIIFSACKEDPPYVNFNKPRSTFDTTYIGAVPTPQPKEVLIEDGSGTLCLNCPTAAVIGNGIVASNPGRVNIYTNYPNIPFGGLTKPVNEPTVKSKYDMRSDIGKDIMNFLGVPSAASLPTGYINRKKFTGNSEWAVNKDTWVGYVNGELALTTPVNIDISNTYDASTKKLSVDVTVTYSQVVTGDNYLHLMILQDSIIDAQESRDANNSLFFDSAYVHRHVLMDMLTAHNGDLLNTTADMTLVPGRVFKKRYEMILGTRTNNLTNPDPNPPRLPFCQWDLKHLLVLGLVTESSTTKYVLQSKEKEVQ
ncbi:MAG: Omp28-related outer membrane protein [Bacteroidota bacterium]